MKVELGMRKAEGGKKEGVKVRSWEGGEQAGLRLSIAAGPGLRLVAYASESATASIKTALEQIA